MLANGRTYKLIRDHDNNGKSLVWLDSTGTAPPGLASLHVQAVNASLVYTLDPGYTVSWTDAAWRQPGSGTAVQFCQCASTSELGHLFYDALGLAAPLINAANPNNTLTLAELDAEEFDDLVPMMDWQDTAWPGDTWPGSYFDMGRGASVRVSNGLSGPFASLAVREAQVPTGVPVSEPSTALLVAAALAALSAGRHRGLSAPWLRAKPSM